MALELGGHVRKGEGGSRVVYVSQLSRTETDAKTCEETEAAIPFHRRAIFTAAAHAQRAADYLHALQPKAEQSAKFSRWLREASVKRTRRYGTRHTGGSLTSLCKVFYLQ
jgi:antirestriction protein ArdC